VIRELDEGDTMLKEGAAVAEVARSLGAIETTWHQWRNTYGGALTSIAALVLH
jgi:transposase-like protein